MRTGCVTFIFRYLTLRNTLKTNHSIQQDMNRYIYSDFYRYTGKSFSKNSIGYQKALLKLMFQACQFRATLCHRKLTEGGKLLRPFWHIMYKLTSHRAGLQIPKEVKIGKGFRIAHWGGIVMNSAVEIGDNFTIHEGCLLGHSYGKYPGVPKIGDNVFMSANSVIIGGVTIGNNVLIAPCTMVNVPVPDDCIVIGSPCRIIPKDKPSEQYIAHRLNQ